MIQLEPHDSGIILPVRAHAGARRNEVRGELDGALCLSVTQAPEKGKANKAIIDLLAKCLKLRRSQIQLLSGEASRQKRFLVQDVSLSELRQALAPWDTPT